jgi:FMN phosphatase YigB (HAD superfamily)
MSRIKLVVFDIAGTIIEDHGEVFRAFAKALMERGIHSAKMSCWDGKALRNVK